MGLLKPSGFSLHWRKDIVCCVLLNMMWKMEMCPDVWLSLGSPR